MAADNKYFANEYLYGCETEPVEAIRASPCYKCEDGTPDKGSSQQIRVTGRDFYSHAHPE